MKYQAANKTNPIALPNCLKANDATTGAGELLVEVAAAAAPLLDLLPPDVSVAVLAAGDAPEAIDE